MRNFKCFLTIILIASNLILNAQTVSFTRHDVDVFDGASDVWAVDIDNDNFTDIIATSYNDGIKWWRNDGNQNFTGNTIAPDVPENSSRTLRVTMHDGSILDFNNDGFVDMVSAMGVTNEVVYWINDGAGNFTPTSIDNTSKGSHTIDVIDFDKDGDIDILASAFGTETEDGEFAIYYNDGSMNFTKEILHTLPTTGGTFIHAGDVDADGVNDILYTEWHWQNPSNLGWYKYTPLGWAKTIIDSFVGMHTAMLKDYDKDGDLDILAAAWNGSYFFIYTNDGAGHFTRTWDKAAFRAIWLDMADFDNDGDNDLLGVAQNPNANPDLYFYKNDGAFNFSTTVLCSDIEHIYAGIPADLDRDGDQDIIVAANESDKIIWWENIQSQTSINDNELTDNVVINVFPNPAADKTSVSFDLLSTENVKLILCDSNGKDVSTLNEYKFNVGYNSISIDTSNLTCGTYYCKLYINEKLSVSKIIVVE